MKKLLTSCLVLASIYCSGQQLGVGTHSPAYQLDATSGANSTARFSSTAGDPNGVILIDVPSASTACNTCSEFIEFTKAGSMIGSISANLSGNSVSYNTTSDKRLKENITPTHFGLADVLKIEVKDYNFIGSDKRARVTGFLAQDLFRIYPDAVKEGDYGATVTNKWAVDYGRVTPLLVKAIQDLNTKVETLQRENEQLKTEAAAYIRLADEVKAMEAKLGVMIASPATASKL